MSDFLGNQVLTKNQFSTIQDIPCLTNEAVSIAEKDPRIGCLIDRVYPGRPLVICFSYVGWETLPNFDFFNRTKKLEASTGRTFNRILLRDPCNLWYQHGVPGLGHDVHEVAARLRDLIRILRPSEIVTIGQSMGGYAAILFGLLLEVERIISFGALAHLKSAQAYEEGDHRWIPVMEMLEKHPSVHCHKDLVELAKEMDIRSRLHVIHGTRLDDAGRRNMDYLHSQQYATVPEAHVWTFPEAPHAVVNWLNDAGKTDAMLQRLLPDTRVSQPSRSMFDEGGPRKIEFKRHEGGAAYVLAPDLPPSDSRTAHQWWQAWRSAIAAASPASSEKSV